MKYSEGIAHLGLKLQDITSVDGLEQEIFACYPKCLSQHRLACQNWPTGMKKTFHFLGKVLSLCCLLETIVVFWITSGLHKEHKLLCSLSLLTVWQIYSPIFQVRCLENECVFEMKTISVLEHPPSGTDWIITCSSPWVILIFPEACTRCFLFSCQNILKRKLFLIKYSNHSVIIKCIFSCQIASSYLQGFAVT